jgi:hypothetical protein
MQIGRHLRNAHPVGRTRKALEVIPDPKEGDLTLAPSKGLVIIEYLLAVMENDGSRFQGQRSVGQDSRVVPTPLGCVIQKKHMVGKIPSKTQICFLLRWVSPRFSQLHRDVIQLSISFLATANFNKSA